MNGTESSLDPLSDVARLRYLLQARDEQFFAVLKDVTNSVVAFEQAIALNTLRKRATRLGWSRPKLGCLRIAVLGGYTLHPLVDLLEHFTSVTNDVQVEIWCGEYDNYSSEIMDAQSGLYQFKPDLVFLLPSEKRATYLGAIADAHASQRAQIDQVVAELLRFAWQIHDLAGAEVVIGNFKLPGHFDPGPLRYSSLGSDYNFKKMVNIELGISLPAYAHICDIEFLANRLGILHSSDTKGWFESKQPCSAELMVVIAREFAHIARSLRQPGKKVLVLDLDNTLWGGTIGDDGLDGIEIGTTTAAGEAYRDFQSFLLSLIKRGVLLAVCSKNDHERAIEPFEKHPEMILRLEHIVSFKANWNPKSDNIRDIAQELNLGLDSLVFVDDNPAEIDIVRQFLPEVETVWLGEDPSLFTFKLSEARCFEQRVVTAEDSARTDLYKEEGQRQRLFAATTDLDAYLRSLEMFADVVGFSPRDVPRIAQLINKSNQFNLTTRRRTEAEVLSLISDPSYVTLTIRLSDRFSDLGIICIVIGKVDGTECYLDTWLMSCRVLKRGVENEALNEVVRLARERGCHRLIGAYVPTAKNAMVKEFYPSMGFRPIQPIDDTSGPTDSLYEFDVSVSAESLPSAIAVRREGYESVASY